MTVTIGVPIKLLHEAQGLTISAELKTGQIYRGKLIAIEDNMNVQLQDVVCTGRDGKVQGMEQVFLRGSHLRFLQLPDNLRQAPAIKNFSTIGVGREGRVRGLGMGKARAEVARATASTFDIFLSIHSFIIFLVRGGKAGLGGTRR